MIFMIMKGNWIGGAWRATSYGRKRTKIGLRKQATMS
jgi:hypothetical protein